MKDLNFGLIVGLIAFAVGCVVGGGVMSLARSADIAEIERQATVQRTADAKAAQEAQESWDLRQAQAAANHQAALADLLNQNNQLKRRISDVSTQYRPFPGADIRPVPQCIFTVGAVGLLNTAHGAGGNKNPGHSGAEKAVATDESLDSGVRLPDVLAWGVDAGTRCQSIESQLNRLIDAVEGTSP